MLYAGDRYESRDFLFAELNQNEVVVLDRYVPSNIAHQGAKVPKPDRAAFVKKIIRLEHEIFGLPHANLTMLLDLPVSSAQALIAKKQARSYTDKKADLQEADANYLENVHQVYLDLARTEQNWHRVECVQAGTLRTVDDIADEIWQTVLDRRAS
jgi:dTMP kinase